MLNDIDNVAESSILVKTNHMAELGAFYQPSLSLRNYKSNFNGFGGDETFVGLYPYGDLRGLISTSETNIPIMLPPPPLLSHVGDSSNETNFPIRPRPYHGGYSGLQGILQNAITIAHPSLHFNDNNNGSDSSQGL
ncbi:hypothetical protein EZV62_025304 [Acer yangbiense]|uniref:Uncharacterized protein n=1 Tax=Acer yangbiense TaxID=1000413 RepID=A0A5C7GY30_9ROSI|nr:hypothetical protein EZV62_025304 [Acer yangbiense]